MTKTMTRARYTLEFKQEAVRLVEGGQSIELAPGKWTPRGLLFLTLWRTYEGRTGSEIHG